ncbi:hypothetical protein ACLI07_23825 (plasmid) [Providencia huaxiensis]|uniref:Uncharacterized protein n=4 Tax=Enterobacterales TaxID=91347 RepID=Q8KK36_PROVU|nr:MULTISPECIES: hypothetical protein [Enterobacterales]ELY4881559.1 hypothetical protein [Morganella morganii]SPY66453.1 Uncharacterised protein [Providencia stuartii]HAZ7869383.1 hypothetical protein [Escherichia coli]ELR5094360.1 hypothetical protein [Providencia rettgeri]ELR5243209.1 hypothetical protein [Providencia rettgeri]
MIIDYLKRQDILLKKHQKLTNVYIPLAIFIVVSVSCFTTMESKGVAFVLSCLFSIMMNIVVKLVSALSAPSSSAEISGLLHHFSSDSEVIEYCNAVIESGAVFKSKQMNRAVSIGQKNIDNVQMQEELEEIDIQYRKVEAMLANGKINNSTQTRSLFLTQQDEK